MVEGRQGPAEPWPQGAVGRGGEEVLSLQCLVHPEHQIDVLSDQNCRVRYLSGYGRPDRLPLGSRVGTLIGPPVPGTRTDCGHEAEPVDLPESAVSALAARKEEEEGTALSPEPTADIGVAFGAEPSVRLDGCVMTCVRGYGLGQSSFPARNVLSAACPSLSPAPR